MTSIDLQNKIVLITGGAGIGVASGICEALHTSGAHLLIVDRDHDALQTLHEKYPQAETFTLDISDSDQVATLFDKIKHHHGRCDGLVNNAGIGLSKEAHTASEAEFERLYAVNVQAMWRFSSAFANLCDSNQQAGSIVNISSVHAHSTQNKYALYCSTKNAVIGMTMGMAVELGPLGIRVNAVGPGYVHAEQNYDLIKTWTDDPQKWVQDFFNNQQVLDFEIRPVDIGNTVAFLLSDLARCITGQNIYVDNGTTSLIFNRDFT